MIRTWYGLRQKVLECINRRAVNRTIRVYMFHRIGEPRQDGFQNIRITEEAFRTFIETKLASGFVFLSPKELEGAFGKNAGIITFDDMFQDAYQCGVSYLEQLQIPYICFLSPGLIGKKDYITKEGVWNLKKSSLCTIGAHGISHGMVRSLSVSEKCREVSREAHEKFFGQKIDCFAYPYGSLYACDRKAMSLIEQEYKYGFSTLDFPLGESWYLKKREFLPRININSENYWKHL